MNVGVYSAHYKPQSNPIYILFYDKLANTLGEIHLYLYIMLQWLLNDFIYISYMLAIAIQCIFPHALYIAMTI